MRVKGYDFLERTEFFMRGFVKRSSWLQEGIQNVEKEKENFTKEAHFVLI